MLNDYLSKYVYLKREKNNPSAYHYFLRNVLIRVGNSHIKNAFFSPWTYYTYNTTKP